MPCYVNGQISGDTVLHGSPGACSANGGTWVDEPSLMKEESTIGDGELQWSDVGSFFRDPVQGTKDYWKGNTASDMLMDASMFVPVAGAGGLALRQGLKYLPRLFTKEVTKKGKDKFITKPHYKGGKYAGTKVSKKIPGKTTTSRVFDPKKTAFVGAPTAVGVGGLIGKQFEDKPAPAPTPTATPTPPPEEKGVLSNLFEGAKDIYGNVNWDQLSELGELIAYYNTPIDKRGEHPETRWNRSQAQLLKAQADLFKANRPEELTFPQFKGNYAENLKELKGEGFIFDDYSDTEMEGLTHKLWLLHNKNPGASFEQLLAALSEVGEL